MTAKGDEGATRATRAGLSCLLLLLSNAGGCAEEPFCDGAGLRSALERAEPGTVIEIGACTINGPIIVPAGVRLVGVGAASTIESHVELTPATVAITPGEFPAVLSRLRIRASIAGALEARGADVQLMNVDVEASSNSPGVTVVSSRSLEMQSVSIEGPSTSAGLLLERVSSARMFDIQIIGFERECARFEDSSVNWTTGRVTGCDVGVAVERGRAELRSVVVENIGGGRSLMPAGLATTGAARLFAEELVVEGVESGPAVRIEGGTSEVVDSRLAGASGGLMARGSEQISIRRSSFHGNRGVGVFVDGARSFELANADVVGTTSLYVVRALTDVGDGVVVLNTRSTSISDALVEDSSRIGMLFQACPASGVSAIPLLDRVEVSGVGEQRGAFGAFVRSVEDFERFPIGWDAGIQRSGAVLTNDTGNPAVSLYAMECP